MKTTMPDKTNLERIEELKKSLKIGEMLGEPNIYKDITDEEYNELQIRESCQKEIDTWKSIADEVMGKCNELREHSLDMSKETDKRWLEDIKALKSKLCICRGKKGSFGLPNMKIRCVYCSAFNEIFGESKKDANNLIKMGRESISETDKIVKNTKRLFEL